MTSEGVSVSEGREAERAGAAETPLASSGSVSDKSTLVSKKNPLTARVAINHIWGRHFVEPLVPTIFNFGPNGKPPTHPELLDWLASALMENNWSMKAIHRLIVTSSTFRQSSRVTPKLLVVDPENKLLGRGPRFRLSAQAIRDQALATSGLLVEQLGGVSVRPYMPAGIWKSISNNKYKQDDGAKLYRRSLYTLWRRAVKPPTRTQRAHRSGSTRS